MPAAHQRGDRNAPRGFGCAVGRAATVIIRPVPPALICPRRWSLDDLSRRSTPAGVKGEFGATRAAGTRLVKAHIALARAEFGEILGEIQRLAIGAGIALGLLLFAGILLPVGGTLFVGEWLFGSIGWGVLHGTEVSIAVSVTVLLAVLGTGRRQILGAILAAVVVAAVVGVVFGLDLTNQGWSRLGDNLFPNIQPGVRPLVSAVAVVGAIVAIIGLLAGLRAGGVGGALGGLVGGAIPGAILGAFTAIQWGPQAGGGAGVAIGLLVWPAALALSVMRRGIDMNAIKDRLLPNETIQTTRETIEWVRKQMPLGRKS